LKVRCKYVFTYISPQSPQLRSAGGGWRVVKFICRLKAAFLGPRLQAPVATGAVVAAVPGGRERGKAECRRRKPKVGARQPKLINPEKGLESGLEVGCE
jgi:hypothetical protein